MSDYVADMKEGYTNKFKSKLYGLLCEFEKNGEWETFLDSILCELLGNWVENGEYPADYKALEKIVKGISYNNAVRYFGFDVK